MLSLVSALPFDRTSCRPAQFQGIPRAGRPVSSALNSQCRNLSSTTSTESENAEVVTSIYRLASFFGARGMVVCYAVI